MKSQTKCLIWSILHIYFMIQLFMARWKYENQSDICSLCLSVLFLSFFATLSSFGFFSLSRSFSFALSSTYLSHTLTSLSLYYLTKLWWIIVPPRLSSIRDWWNWEPKPRKRSNSLPIPKIEVTNSESIACWKFNFPMNPQAFSYTSMLLS